MVKDKVRYCKVHFQALKEFNLTPAQGIFMHLIHDLSQQKGWCYAGKLALSRIMNVSKPTIFKLLKDLENKGLLERIHASPEGMTTTVVRPTAEWKEFEDRMQIQNISP